MEYAKRGIVIAGRNQIKQCALEDVLSKGDVIKVDKIYCDDWADCRKNSWIENDDGTFTVHTFELLIPRHLFKVVTPKNLSELLDDF